MGTLLVSKWTVISEKIRQFLNLSCYIATISEDSLSASEVMEVIDKKAVSGQDARIDNR